MMKETYTYTHDHADDTTIELIKTPNRTEIIVTFDHEDPNVGREIAVYGGDADEPFNKLADEWAEEVDNYLGGDKANAFVYDEYTSNMWYCIANAMNWLCAKVFEYRNKDGNPMWYCTIREAGLRIAHEFRKPDGVKRFGFLTVNESSPRDYKEHLGELWFGIEQVDTNMNDDYSLMFVADYYGGGSASFGKFDCYDDDSISDEEVAYFVRKTMIEALKAHDEPADKNTVILLERIDKEV